MTPDAATPAPPSRRRRWRIRWVLAVTVFALCAYGAWRQYDFRTAIHDAQSLGWEFKFDDPIDVIRKDWKAAFSKATWTNGRRSLRIAGPAAIDGHARLLQRLAPKALILEDQPGLKELSTLKGLSELRTLSVLDCDDLTNLDSLGNLPALQRLYLIECIGLTDVRGLKNLPALYVLHLISCTGLKNTDALKELPELQILNLSDCIGLTNVDGLKGLTMLQKLSLLGCTNLPPEAVAALKAALPNTEIRVGE